MAQNDPYTPDYEEVDDGQAATFDGSDAETGAAIVSGAYANFDALVFIEASDDGGSTWQTIAQLTDDEGQETFGADWHTQFNRLMVREDVRRLRFVNADEEPGVVAIDGDER